MTDATRRLATEAAKLERVSPTAPIALLRAIIDTINEQDKRIAALERPRPRKPLEGTGPLPLERK